VRGFALLAAVLGLSAPAALRSADPAVNGAAAAGKLVDRIKKAKPPKQPGEGCTALYMMDLVAGGTTLVESVGDEGWDKAIFSSPSWSADGRRIYYDVRPGKEFNESQIFLIELTADGVKRTAVGVGQCPGLSADGKQLVMLLNDGAVPGAEAGVYLAPPAGGKIRPLRAYGQPRWSPTGKEILVSAYTSPKELTLVDAENAEQQSIALAGHTFPVSPYWVADKLLVGVVKSGDEATIALVDVTKPGEAKVKETLWKRDPDAPVSYTPTNVIYSQAARRGVFVGQDEAKKKFLSVFEPGKPPMALDADRKGGGLPSGLALSPDGRYLLFCDLRRD
jgi:hypothetical protein